jgi:hypothetical protein
MASELLYLLLEFGQQVKGFQRSQVVKVKIP